MGKSKKAVVECSVCHKKEEAGSDLFDCDLYICGKCGKMIHMDCLGLEPDSELDSEFVDWFNEHGENRECMPEKFCPHCRSKAK